MHRTEDPGSVGALVRSGVGLAHQLARVVPPSGGAETWDVTVISSPAEVAYTGLEAALTRHTPMSGAQVEPSEVST